MKCPTDGMWADILKKPLQGKAFRVMRSKLINCSEDYVENKETGEKQTKSKPVAGRVSKPGYTQPLQECVGRSRISRRIPPTDR